MKLLKKIFARMALTTMVLVTAVTSGPVLAQDVPEIEADGVIHEVLVETNRLIISGVRYQVAYDATVEIRGTYGAFTLLQTGMKVAFKYRAFDESTREIYEIAQLPDNSILEES